MTPAQRLAARLLASAVMFSVPAAALADTGTAANPQPDQAKPDKQVVEAANTASSGGVETVEVTALKRKENIQDVPATVTVVGGDKIKDDGLTQANQVANFVPNFNGDAATGHQNPRWYLRGLGNSVPGNGQTSPVGVYVDEVYIGIPAAQDFPLFDLERVEVLSGPQGTLWGRNTTGGALNFISRKPDFDGPSGYARGEYGDYGSSLLEGAYGAALSDTLAVRIAASTIKDDGFGYNPHDGSRIAQNEDTGVRLQGLYRPNEDFSLLVNAHYRRGDDTGDYAAGLSPLDAAGQPVSLDPTRQSSYGVSGSYIEQRGVSANANWQIGDLNLVSISALDDYKNNYLNGTDVNHEGTHQRWNLAGREVSEELRLSSPSTDRFNWIFGAYTSYEELNSDTDTAVLPNTVGLHTTYASTQFVQDDRSYAAFANASYNITAALKISGGVRETVEEKSINLNSWGTNATTPGVFTFLDQGSWWSRDSVTGPGLSTQAVQDTAKTWNAFTYDVSPQYDIADNLHSYVRVSRGFRSGGFNPGATTQTSVATVDPEYVTSYEGGLKTDWFDHRLRLDGDYFYNNYSNIQVTVIQLPLSQLRNAGKGWSQGFEASFSALPIENLSLSGTLGLLSTKYSDFPNCKPGGISCSGNQFVRSPHLSAHVDGQYTVPLEDGSRIVLDTDWSYRTSEFFNAGTQTAPLLQGPVLTGDATLSYYTPNNVKLYVYSRNITDASYATTIIPSATLGYQKNFSLPRLVGAGIDIPF